MASAWRIVRASRANTAFTGEGPWRYGGRWNSPGVRVVYVSEHQSTAAFEVFANRVPFILEEKYKAFHLEWPDSLTEIFPAKKLPCQLAHFSAASRDHGNWRPLDSREAFCGVGFAKCHQSSRHKFSVKSRPSGFQTHPHSSADRLRLRPALARPLTEQRLDFFLHPSYFCLSSRPRSSTDRTEVS